MQVKIVIGTISFMLTMIILGFAALREPIRMQEYALAFEGRSIETGAHIYESNCATCHGIEGKAEECYDAVGNIIGCQGLALNNPRLLCGDKSERMEALVWDGTKYDFIKNTVAAGRVGRGMPTWSEDFGGPMRDDQVNDVVHFVLNWEVPDEAAAEGEAAWCDFTAFVIEDFYPATVEDFFNAEGITFPGDAERGAELYISPYGCSGCHGDINDSNHNGTAPWLGDIAERGGSIVEGYTAHQYVYESILHPSEVIAAECPNGPCSGPPSIMSGDFGQRMNDNGQQDLADIMTYILGE